MSRLIAPLIALIALVFASAPAPLEAQDAYKLRSGDTLRIEVLEDPSLNRALLIAPDGRVSVPLVGGVRAAGRSVEAVQADIAARLTPNFATTPNVFVALQAQRPREPFVPRAPEPDPTIDVFVVGEAGSPGKLVLEEESTLLHLFAQMGGFSKFAATKRLQLRRGNEIIPINYRDIEAGISTLGTMLLKEGDVLVVPQRRLFE
ncbi:polysaccharide biosynthesis/export family protein [Primorskyibacter sp. S187A]|uniref:polysaccharide biosynthesis/export family protein n=1 Tax=Primorskyibacter sp. S187A TaxID=3415130 RepID=UPI003C7B7C2E